jgi:hypothetical protein
MRTSLFGCEITKLHLSIAVLGSYMSFAGCSCGEGDGITVLRPGIELTPEALAFGDVPLGAQKELALSVKNIGNDVLRVCVEGTDLPQVCEEPSSIEPVDSPFAAIFENLEETDKSWAVAKQMTRDLIVRFRPLAAQSFSGTLTIVHNGTNSPTIVELTGTGIEPQLMLSSDRLDFGEVTAGMKKSLDLTLTNPTQFPQPIDIPALVQDSLIFGTADANGAETPAGAPLMAAVPGNSSLTIKVWFQPLDALPYQNTLVINFCPTCTASVTLTGVGIKPVFELVPPQLDFGTVDEGTPVTLPFAVVNIGTSNLEVRAIGLEAGTTNEFSVAPRQALPAIVLPGMQLDVDVTYLGTTPSVDMGRVQVETNAWDDPSSPLSETVKFVALQAISRGPDIDALPPIVNFGTVAVGGHTTRNLIIQNSGNAQLRLDSATFTSGSTEIVLRTTPPLPAMIDPAGSVQFVFEYNPTDAGIDEGDIVFVSNDRDEGSLSIHVQGLGGVPTTCSISVAPSQVTFGLVERGRNVTLPVELRNSGAQPCNVSNIRLTGAVEFSFSTAPAASINIPAGSSTQLDINYAPADYGMHSTLLEAASDDPAQAMLQVPMTGASAPSDLLVTPSSLDFNVVPVTCRSPQRNITLYNTGSNNITVTNIYLDPSTSPEFELTPVSVPFVLTPGGSATITLRYHPADIGTDTGVMFISHSNNAIPVAVPLSGEGQINPTVTDTFNQLPTPQADVLFVVDNSGSMSEEQALLGQNIGSFVQFAQQQMIDYQIAVTTTDVDTIFGGEGGRMVGNPIFLTPATPNANTVFSQRVNGLGTGGSADEQGLEAAYLALSDPIINTDNLGFLRTDAALAVVIVSDEEDSSPQTTQFYENFFRNIKGFQNSSLFSLSAVVGTTNPSCSSGAGNAAYGARYIAVAQATGGVVESICNANWGQTLANIGLNSFGLRRSFQLSSQPVPVTIAVEVDGVPTPATTPAAQVNWSYDAATNSIVFATSAVPDANSVITVTYSVACLP